MRIIPLKNHDKVQIFGLEPFGATFDTLALSDAFDRKLVEALEALTIGAPKGHEVVAGVIPVRMSAKSLRIDPECISFWLTSADKKTAFRFTAIGTNKLYALFVKDETTSNMNTMIRESINADIMTELELLTATQGQLIALQKGLHVLQKS